MTITLTIPQRLMLGLLLDEARGSITEAKAMDDLFRAIATSADERAAVDYAEDPVRFLLECEEEPQDFTVTSEQAAIAKRILGEFRPRRRDLIWLLPLMEQL